MDINMTTFGSIIAFLFIVSMLLPTLIVAMSPRVAGSEKALWVLVALLGSWLGLIAFLLAKPALAPTINGSSVNHPVPANTGSRHG